MIGIQMATVTGYSTPDDFLGLGKVQILQVTIEGDTDATPAILMNPSGDDSIPMKGDRIAVLRIGNFRIALGSSDQITPEGSEGEKKFYSRDSDGNISAYFYMKSDGSVLFESVKNSTFSMIFGTTTIEFSAAGMKITTAAGSYNFLTHTHPTGTGPSGPPTLGT